MPPKNKNKDFQKTVLNPYQNRNLGRRTGKDIKAGKNIRITKQGFENFDDYWSESEADVTKDGTFLLESAQPARAAPAGSSSSVTQPALLPLPPTGQAEPEDISTTSCQSILIQSQVRNVEPMKGVLNPYLTRQIGRRTGKDIKAGKNIRILENGFENFDDYWSESDAESIASFSTTSTSIHKAATTKHSSGPTIHAKEDKGPSSKDSILPQSVPSNLDKASGQRDKALDRLNTDAEGDTVNKPGSEEDQENQDVSIDAGELHSQEGHDESRYVNLSRRQSALVSDDQGKTAIRNKDAPNEKATDAVRAVMTEDKDQTGEKDTCEELDEAEDEDTAGSGKSCSKTMSSEDRQADTSGSQKRTSQDQPSTSVAVPDRSKSKQGFGSATKTQTVPDTQQDAKTSARESPKSGSKQKEKGAKARQRTSDIPQSHSVATEEASRKSHAPAPENLQDQPVRALDYEDSTTGKKSSRTPQELGKNVQRRTSSPNDVIGAEEKSSTKKVQHGCTEWQIGPGEQEAAGKETLTSPKESRIQGVGQRDETQTKSSQEKEGGSETGTNSQVSSTGSKQAVEEITAAVSGGQESGSNVQQAGRASSVRMQGGAQSLSAASHSQTSHPKLPTQGSLSQVNLMASPLAASQQSSVYLSLAGDVTGSITRLRNTAAVSPAPKHFGTRKRLSYSGDSPSSDPPVKTTKARLNVPQPISRNSLKPLASPIPEDHREDDVSVQPKMSQCTENTQSEDEFHLEANPAVGTHQQQELAAQRNRQPLSSQIDVGSEPSVSETGMFVSLANQSVARTTATHTYSMFSNSDDEEFDILDQRRVYHSKIKGVKTKAGAAGKRSTSKGSVIGVKLTNKISQKKATKKKSSSSNDDVSASPSVTATQSEKIRKAGGKKSSFSDNANTVSASPSVTATQSEKIRKAGGKKSSFSDNANTVSASPSVTATQSEKIRKAGGKKSSSSDNADTPQVVSKTQKKSTTEKGKQVSRKKSSDPEDGEVNPVDCADVEMDQTPIKKKATTRKKHIVDTVDGSNGESPQTVKVKKSKGEKVISKKPSPSLDAGEASSPSKRQTLLKGTKKKKERKPASDTEDAPDRADSLLASHRKEGKPRRGRRRTEMTQGQAVEENNLQSVPETAERNKRRKIVKGERNNTEDEVQSSTEPQQYENNEAPATHQTEQIERENSEPIIQNQATEKTEKPDQETVGRGKRQKKSKMEAKITKAADSGMNSKSPAAAESRKRHKSRVSESQSETDPESVAPKVAGTAECEIDTTSPATAKSRKKQKSKTSESNIENDPDSKTTKKRKSAGRKRKNKQVDDIEGIDSVSENLSTSLPKKSKLAARQSAQSETLFAQKKTNVKSSKQSCRRRLTQHDVFIDHPNTQVVHVDVHAEDVYDLSPDIESKSKRATGSVSSKRKSDTMKGRASAKARSLTGRGEILPPVTDMRCSLADDSMEYDASDNENEDSDRKAVTSGKLKPQSKRVPASRKSTAEISPTEATDRAEDEEQIVSAQKEKRVSSEERSGGKVRRLSGMTRDTTPASKNQAHRVSSTDDEKVSLENEGASGETPLSQCLSHLDIDDSALKSGISFRRFSKLPSSLKASRSCQFASDMQDDIISTPPHSYKVARNAVLHKTTLPQAHGKSKKEKRRVTINNTVTHHSLTPDGVEGTLGSTTVLPSLSSSPVHYHQMASPCTPKEFHREENKIVHPVENADGLRRSHRTRVKPLEWYKNERIIYDRRQSGPVVMAVQPSREHLYLANDKLKRKIQEQKKLLKKKQRAKSSPPGRRLSTHLPVPSNLDVTVSTDIPVQHPDTKQEMLMGCFNPMSAAVVIGPQGNDPSPDDPFTLKLMGEQKLFSTGILTLAPASEKPLQRAVSTAVLYSITYGKIVVTINRATAVMETGDHFFIPRGTVYSLKNLRMDEASLSFVNLMVENAENSAAPSVRPHNQQASPISTT